MGQSPDRGRSHHGHDWDTVHPMQGRDHGSNQWLVKNLEVGQIEGTWQSTYQLQLQAPSWSPCYKSQDESDQSCIFSNMFSLQWPSSWRSPACSSSMLLQWWCWPVTPECCSNPSRPHHSSMSSKIGIWNSARRTGTVSSHPNIHLSNGSLDEESQQNQDQTLWNPGNSGSPLSLASRDQIYSFIPTTVWNVETVLIVYKFWNIDYFVFLST